MPFLVWGRGVAHGATSTRSTATTPTPARAARRYSAARQPVRNGDLANLATDLLGLPAVRGSELDADHDLDVR